MECSQKNKKGYIFRVKENVGAEKTTFFLIFGLLSRFMSLVLPLNLYGVTGTVMALLESYV